MDEAFAEIARMPGWAQAGLTLFVVALLVMVLEPGIIRRRYRRQFAALAHACGTRPSEAEDAPASFKVDAAGRGFEVRHQFASRGESSYRGPTGHLLVTATALAGKRWELHQVDFVRLEGWLARLSRAKAVTGGPSGMRFGVVEDGLPVREGWLDSDTRAAVAAFLEAAPREAEVWIRECRLSCLISGPWKVDGPGLRALLERQSALAGALDRTAR